MQVSLFFRRWLFTLFSVTFYWLSSHFTPFQVRYTYVLGSVLTQLPFVFVKVSFSRRCSVTSNFTSNIYWLRFNHYILSLHIFPRVSDHYIFLTFSRRYSYFFRNENMKNICEKFTSNIWWLRLKIIFLYENEFQHFCKFYFEYLLITVTFLHILPRISAHFGNKILNSRDSELHLQAYSSNPVENNSRKI